MPFKSFKRFLTEVEIVPLAKKGGGYARMHLAHEPEWMDDNEKHQQRGRLVSRLGAHDVYKHSSHSYEGRHAKEVAYHVVHRATDKPHLAVHGTEYKHKKGGGSGFQISDLGASRNSTVKAHDVYHHLLKHHHSHLISSDTQSHGGRKTWLKLAHKKGVKTHAWKPHPDAGVFKPRHAGKPWNVDIKKKGTTLTHTKHNVWKDTHGKADVKIVAHRGKK